MEAQITSTPYHDATGTPAWHIEITYFAPGDIFAGVRGSHRGWFVTNEQQAAEFVERLREACAVLGIEIVATEEVV